MPTINGEPNPITSDLPAPSTTGKRKRVQSHDEKSAQDHNSPAAQSQEKTKLAETLRNVVKILTKDDEDLQLLTCPLPSSSSKPRSKRAKVSEDKDDSTNATIQSRVDSGRYGTVQEFLSDIEKASSSVIERKQSQGVTTNGGSAEGAPLTEVVNRIAAFKKTLNTLFRQASHENRSDVKMEHSEDDAEAPAKFPSSNVGVREEKVALTFFGNPSNPKQLFSSLQKSVKVPLPSLEDGLQKSVEVQTPLRDSALPNGITATKVVPFNPSTTQRKFGEVFAPRLTLPQLEPPRKTRPPSKNWIDPFDAATDITAFPGEWNNYSLAYLPSGLWLQYGGITSSPSFWDRKQKQQPLEQRDSGDVAKEKPEDSTLWTEDDPTALQGVYSSFAPSFDSSGAILQVDSKDLVWWNSRGSKRLQQLLSIQQSEGSGEQQPDTVGELDESSLEECIKAFEPDESAGEIARIDAHKDQKLNEMDEVLGEVSELLETLSSYQRIRNLDAPTASGQTSKGEEKSPDLGTPSTPSEAEQCVFETLKSSLVAIVSNLPPYAVAKLNGDQLAELNISQRLVVDNPDYCGTMEKDDFTLQQERAAAVGHGNIPTGRASITSSSRSRSYQGSQSAYNQRVYAGNTRVQQTAQYYGRQPASGAYSPGQFSGPVAPATPSQRSYIAPYSTPQYNLQRQAQNGYNPYSGQPGTPSAQVSPQQYTTRGPQPYNAAFGGARSASPQKQPTYGAQQRTPYAATGANTPQQRYLAQQQHPNYANYPSNQAPPSSTPYQASTVPASYARTASEQATLMDRNKTQLAASQSRRGSATPQPGFSRQQSQSSEQGRSATPRKQTNTPVPA